MISSKPSQYIKGWVEFYRLRFKVTPDVLIPRPETELLIDEVLSFLKHRPTETPTILDIGTGSGNIAISLATHLPTSNVGIKIIATDISKKALKVAKQNAKLHGVEKQITFLESNLLGKITQQPDIIVTNLPYIPTKRIPNLDSSVKDFEPLVALDGGEDGFDLYRKLFTQIKKLNWNPKLIAAEIDNTQENIAYAEAKKYFPLAKIEVKFDLAHQPRILLIRRLS